jgi:hypothetical protein
MAILFLTTKPGKMRSFYTGDDIKPWLRQVSIVAVSAFGFWTLYAAIVSLE